MNAGANGGRVAAAMMLLSLAACGSGAAIPRGMVVRDARAFEARAGATAAAYVIVLNATDSADVLDSVTSPMARFVSLYSQKMENGFVTMSPLDHPAIPAGDSLVLQPGGDHMMLESVDRDLTPGVQLPLTFWFHRAGRIDVSATVRPYGS